jgi:hypothetical protein
MKIIIDSKEYDLDIDKALVCRALKPVLPKYPLEVGDVYKARGYAPFILIQPYYNNRYTFVGCNGLLPFSNADFQTPMSKTEISDYLFSIGAEFSHNIQADVRKLL